MVTCKMGYGRGSALPCRRFGFTLLEVVIAIAILSLGMVAYLSLVGASQRRLEKARETWRNFHMLSQAAEYYLLQGFDDPESPGPEVFDYPGYQVYCRFEEPEGIPEEFTDLTGQARLKRCIIELVRTSDGVTVDALDIDRIDYDDTTDSEMQM